MTRFPYYEYLMLQRRNQALRLLGVAPEAAAEPAPESPPETPPSPCCPPPVMVISQPPMTEKTPMRNEGPSSLAWMLILLLMMGSIGLTVLLFLVLTAAGFLVPGSTSVGVTAIP